MDQTRLLMDGGFYVDKYFPSGHFRQIDTVDSVSPSFSADESCHIT